MKRIAVVMLALLSTVVYAQQPPSPSPSPTPTPTPLPEPAPGKAPSAKTPSKAPAPTMAADATYKDIKATLGIVPTFFKAYPEHAIAAAWAEMKAVQLGPTTLSGK